MAWTAPSTASVGGALTAALWNSDVRDNVGFLYAEQRPSNRNFVYNGAMQVAQRGTSVASITTSGYYTADRWVLAPATMGTWTNSVESDGPSGSGLAKSLKVLCTTADASPAAADQVFVQQIIEGQDLQRIAKGTASAQQITLSFWVKSNVTGTYTILFYDDDNARSVSASYAISVSATWERVVITFPADITGAITNDNTSGMTVRFNLGAGSNYTSGTLATTWGSYTAANTAVGQTNLASAINNYWQVTGVQLETGPIAKPFDFLPFGDELGRCQRYYEKSYEYGTAPGAVSINGNGIIIANAALAASTAGNSGGVGVVPFKVTKRAVPTMVIYDYDGTANAVRVYPADQKRSGITAYGGVASSGFIQFVTFNNSSATAIAAGNQFAFSWTADAEL